MADKLTSRQQAQVAVLESLPARFAQMHRLIEEMAGARPDISVVRRLCRLLDEGKGATSGVGLSALTQTMGSMGMLARRTGGETMKIRALREGLASLKINFDGALRTAKTPLPPGQDEPPPGA
jgi:hypothetical protein